MDTANVEASLVTVTSADGTPIVVERVGAGEPLVMVHGAAVDRSVWRAVAPALAERFELWLVARRGRGGSGDAAAYDPEREVEDLRAVFERVGRPLGLFGHSSGAVLALEAARRSGLVRRLVLYEPPMAVDGTRRGDEPGGPKARVEALLAAGDRAGAVRTFYRLGPRVGEEALARMEAGRSWPVVLALAHTLPYDMAVVGAFGFDPDRLAQVRQPTLLLVGGASSPWDHRVAEALAGALPSARVVVLPEQGHRAMATAPELLAGEVAAFLGAGSTEPSP